MPFSIEIPTEAVQLMDGEEAVMPTQGDTVSVTIEGTVEAMDGGTVSIYAMKANGVDLGGDPEAKAQGGGELDREGMMAMLEASGM